MSSATAERYRLALEAGRIGTWAWDATTGRVDWDEPLERLYGLEPGTFGGTMDDYLALLHPDDVAPMTASVQSSVETGADHDVEHRVLLPGGRVRWVRGTGRSVVDPDGTVTGMVGVAADITDQRETQEARRAAEAARAAAQDTAARSQARLALLGRISGVLGGSLDVATTLQQVADLVVHERLADWCVVQLPGGSHGVSQVALAHVDPAMIDLARQVQEAYPPELRQDSGLGKVLATGEAEFWPTVPPDALAAAARDATHLELLRSLNLSAAMVIPLAARGRILGAMTLIGTHGRSFDTGDLEAAVQTGVRAGMALDNANLYAERDQVARTLQRSLLPPALPDVPGLDLAAHYRPGSAAHGIGGDFYDVFPAGGDSWRVVVGDVCGKGVEAAALTAAVRYALRTAAVLTHSPAQVLSIVNETLLRDSWDERFATLAFVALDLDDDGARVTVAGGGHPAPLVRRADGSVEQLETDGMLVGALAEADFTETTTRLRAGDCLLLYTDGATEAGLTSDLFGEARLRATLAHAPADSATSVVRCVADAVERFAAVGADGVGTAGSDDGLDDLALIAVLVR